MPSSERTAAYAELKLDNPGSAASISAAAQLKWRQLRQATPVAARPFTGPTDSRKR